MMAVLTVSEAQPTTKIPEHRNYEIGHGEINGHVQTPEFKPQSSWKKSSMIVHTPVIPVLWGTGTGEPLPLTDYRPCSRVSKRPNDKVENGRTGHQISSHDHTCMWVCEQTRTCIYHKHHTNTLHTSIEVTNRLCFPLLNLVIKNTVTCHPTQHRVF